MSNYHSKDRLASMLQVCTDLRKVSHVTAQRCRFKLHKLPCYCCCKCCMTQGNGRAQCSWSSGHLRQRFARTHACPLRRTGYLSHFGVVYCLVVLLNVNVSHPATRLTPSDTCSHHQTCELVTRTAILSLKHGHLL